MAKQQNQKSQKDPVDALSKIMKYSLKLNQEREAKIMPGYYRPLKSKEEQIAVILFDHKGFRDTIKKLHRYIRDPKKNDKENQKLENRWAQSCMQHYEYDGWVKHPGFTESFVGQEMARTYAWNLETEEYGGKGFSIPQFLRECEKCGTTLDIWTDCFDCFFHYDLLNTRKNQEELEVEAENANSRVLAMATHKRRKISRKLF